MMLMFFAILTLSSVLSAQVQPKKPAQTQPQKPGQPTVKKSSGDHHINIRWADEFNYNIAGIDTIQKLTGNVELNQDTVFLFCDSATILNSTDMVAQGNFILQQGDSLTIFADSAEYSSLTKIAELFSNVSMVKGQQKLFTERLTYDVNTKIATYLTGATMTDDTTFLASKRGYFHGDTDDIFFGDSVVVVNPDFTLRSDTMKFNASSKIVSFVAPTLISQKDTAKIYTEDGFYDINKKFAEFTKNPQYLKNDQRAWAKIMRYDGKLEEVTLIGDAHFQDSTSYATADRIRYNQRTEVTILDGNAFIQDETRTITGDRVIYDAKNETYSTRGRSHIVDDNQILDANEVDYDKERELGIARGNVIWQDTTEKLTIVCEFAEHSKKKNFLKASGGRGGRPLLIRLIDGDSLYISADTLMSLTPEDAAKRQPQPARDSVALNSLAELPAGKVTETEIPADSIPAPPPVDLVEMSDSVAVANLVETSDSMAVADLVEMSDTAAVADLVETSEPPAVPEPPERPESPVLETPLPPASNTPQKLFEIPDPPEIPATDTISTPLPDLLDELEDSTEVVISPQPKVSKPKPKEKKDEPRIILAYHDVRIFKSDLQATCDSLSYSTLDSMFRLYRLPVIWSDTSQFTADTVKIQLANDKIDRIYLRVNSFIVNSPDELFFNQIKGKNSTAIFEDGELRRVRVEGNAESVYYALDDEEAYIGVNKTVCSEMMIYFGDNELEGIRFYAEPSANLFPMKKAGHEDLKMPGFSWQEEKRPKSVDDLFTKREAVPPPVILKTEEEAAPAPAVEKPKIEK